MLSALSKKFSSLPIKLFLFFWLIAVLSIAITRFISNQFEQESIIVPIHQDDLRKLQRISRRIAKQAPNSVEELLNKIPIPNNISIILKDQHSQAVFLNHKRHLRSIGNYLKKNEFTNNTTVQFPFVRLTGSVPVRLQNKDYQLYITHRTRPPAMDSMLMQLPIWSRFVIPLIVSVILCWLLARTLTKPLMAIKKASTDFGNGHYDVRVNAAVKRSDEIGEMANSFNQMAEKLSANIDAHQRLLADVSHELRSPMTRLQMTLGLIEQASDNNPAITKHLARCEQEISQLDNLITNILSLSRLENSFQPLNFASVNLHALLNKLVTDNQYLLDEKAITVQQNYPEHLILLANETLLYSAINNIFINAIKYSNTNGCIELNCDTKHDKIIISISDKGIGVPEGQIPLLFEPFYRVSNARDRDSGGTGLGLAIAKQVIERHHGQISAQNNHGGGLTITLELPLTQT